MNSQSEIPIPKDLLEILVCPACRNSLITTGQDSLLCTDCRVAYPVRNGIPILLVDQAIPIAS